MIICIVNSEEEYLDLIAHFSKYGKHVPNRYANADEDGMSVCDRFERLPAGIAEEYLGVRDYEWEVTIEKDENGEEWEVEPTCGEGPLNRDTLHICPELVKDYRLLVPTAKDYPILIMWDWDEDFDRWGAVNTRYFDWISVSSIPSVASIMGKINLWLERYSKDLLEE